MSKYTTGELAKLCGVSVRTVQYYDSRGILVPSALTDGGRRLYSEQDRNKLKIICFLREMELPIDSIKGLLEEPHPEQTIGLLFQEQEKLLRQEIREKQALAARIGMAQKLLREMEQVSMASVGDIAYIMERRKKLRRLRGTVLVMGFMMEAIEISTLMLGMLQGTWWPFFLGLVPWVGLGVTASLLYYRHTAYICPECHTVFKPRARESFFARHTPNTRRLTCPQCGRLGYCVETYGKEIELC